MSIFPNSADDGLPLVALLSSSWVEDLLCAFGRHRAYENSAVANLPFGEATLDHARGELTQLAIRSIGALHSIAITRETSPFFVRVLKLEQDNAVRAHAQDIVTATCDQIDEIVAGSLFPYNREKVSLVSDKRSGLFRKYVFEDESPDEHSARILSIGLGIVFGRWDIRYATGERPAPELPDPFAPLPVCPPGLLQGDDGLPLSPEAGRRLRDEGHYPLDVAWDGILVDDPEHPLDLERRVHAKKDGKTEPAPTIVTAPTVIPAVAPAVEPKQPSERHYRIAYDAVGYSYQTIFGDYLPGAEEIVIEDAYVRQPHQITNFLRFCETAVRCGKPKKIVLITKFDNQLEKDEAMGRLFTLGDSLKEHGVALEIKENNALHDREIRFSNGWTIKIGRGFDIYQKPDDCMTIGANDLDLRPCLETVVDIFQTKR